MCGFTQTVLLISGKKLLFVVCDIPATAFLSKSPTNVVLHEFKFKFPIPSLISSWMSTCRSGAELSCAAWSRICPQILMFSMQFPSLWKGKPKCAVQCRKKALTWLSDAEDLSDCTGKVKFTSCRQHSGSIDLVGEVLSKEDHFSECFLTFLSFPTLYF